MDFRKIVEKEWADAIAGGAVDIPQLAQVIADNHPEEFAIESQHMAMNQVRRMLKSIAKRSANASPHPDLFGFPGVVAVPRNIGGFYYTMSSVSTYVELQSALHVRMGNRDLVVSRCDQFAEALEKVRPIMEGTGITLAEAIRILGDKGGMATT